jgi:hypothetical protein
LQDEVTWECFCRRLLDEQEDVSPGRLPNFDAPAALRAQLGLPSFRALYQVGCAAGPQTSCWSTLMPSCCTLHAHHRLHCNKACSVPTALIADLPCQLMQVLHQLGGWPSGLWQRVDEGAEPYGELLQVGTAA